MAYAHQRIVDVQTGHVYVYGEEFGYSDRVYLLYDGMMCVTYPTHYLMNHRCIDDHADFILFCYITYSLFLLLAYIPR